MIDFLINIVNIMMTYDSMLWLGGLLTSVIFAGKILLYRNWKRQLSSAQAKVLDVREVKRKFAPDAGLREYILALEYDRQPNKLTTYRAIAFVRKYSRSTVYDPPQELRIFYARRDGILNIRTKVNIQVPYIMFTAVIDFFTLWLVGSLVVFTFHKCFADMPVLYYMSAICYILTVNRSIGNFINGNLIWGHNYKNIYLNKTSDYSYTKISSAGLRFEMVKRKLQHFSMYRTTLGAEMEVEDKINKDE